MIHLKDQIVQDEHYRLDPKEDLIRIQKALFVLREIYCTLDECGNIWQNCSWDVKASWLFIPENAKEIISYIETSRGFESYKDWASIE